MTIEIGSKAPEFDLPADSWDTSVSLGEKLADGPVILFFYPGDWSSICSDQLDGIEDHLPHFEERGVKVVAISVDTPWSHAAFAHARELTIPLLSDFDRETSRDYGVLREEGFPNRAYFIIDAQGTILAGKVEDLPSESPDIDDVISDLDRTLAG